MICIGENIRRLRRERDITQDELAEFMRRDEFADVMGEDEVMAALAEVEKAAK